MRFNEAAAIAAEIPPLSRPTQETRNRFNEAAAIAAEIQVMTKQGSAVFDTASMRPPQLRRKYGAMRF